VGGNASPQTKLQLEPHRTDGYHRRPNLAGAAFSPTSSSRSARCPDESKPQPTGHPDMSSPLTATIPAEPFQLPVARFLCTRFLCPTRPGVVPRQLTGRRVAFRLETIAELRSLNFTQVMGRWGMRRGFLGALPVTQPLPQMNSCCRLVNSCKRPALAPAGSPA
jgi:hypothetical protein